jgi:hypothetical protein
MFPCVKDSESKNIYEVRITKKVRTEGVRIVPDNNNVNKDGEKEVFLANFATVIGCVFDKVYFYEGNILVSDYNNDYIVSMIKKTSLTWISDYEKKADT